LGFSISKNSGATVYTITHFSNINLEAENPAAAVSIPTDDDQAAVILKDLGPLTRIILDWIIIQEASSVVSGTGSPVTGAPEQAKYLLDTLRSQGVDQILDEYVLTITFSGGVTIVRTGHILKFACPMSSDTPLTFNAHLEFLVGDVL